MLINLRNRDRERFDIPALISAVAAADVVRVLWPNNGAEVIKGRQLLRRIVRTGRSQQVRALAVEIANTAQAADRDAVGNAPAAGDRSGPCRTYARDRIHDPGGQ
jgi:hypothetical protein